MRLRPRELSRRQQRLIVFLAVLMMAGATALTIAPDHRGNTAEAAVEAPFSCGPTNNRRETLQMWNGSMGSSAFVGTMTPCLSGVEMTLRIPPVNNSARISSVSRFGGARTITVADGSTRGNIYHLGFRGFEIRNDNARNVTLQSTSGTATNHRLRLAPDAGAIFGGGDVVTDLLVRGDSTIVINDMPVSWLGTCGMLGGSGGSTCTVQVQNISQSLVNLANAIGISTFNIREMDLKIYYIATHSSTGGVPSGNAFQLPNTLITAGDL